MDSTVKADQSGSADDMLAQLAGEEIDRLLAEAEAGNPPPGAAPGDVPAPEQGAATAVSAPIDAPTPVASAVEAPRTSDPEPSSHQADATAAAAETSGVDKASKPGDTESPEPAAAHPDEIIPEKTPEAPGSDAVAQAALQSDFPTTAAAQPSQPPPESPPRQASATVATPVPAPVAPLISPEALAGDDPTPPSLFMRLINACLSPLESIPDGPRNAMGKVAIVTLLNALAALAYLMIFKHHHQR